MKNTLLLAAVVLTLTGALLLADTGKAVMPQ